MTAFGAQAEVGRMGQIDAIGPIADIDTPLSEN
jgi:hypothetical protein